MLDSQLLGQLRQQVDERLRHVYPQGPALLAEPVEYVLSAGGKRLRPILSLLSAKASGGDYTVALPGAVAVEILHNFTLVHDDLMDQDHTRHGQPTVHKKWDQGVAILTGDALFILATQELQTTAHNREYSMDVFLKGALAVCEGQALDLEFEIRDDVTVEQYLQMIDLKTGYLLGLSAQLGALAAGASQAQATDLRDYGRLVGRAFQIQDDLLELYSDAKTMGKSLGSDILAEKKTYLMIRGLEVVPEKIGDALALARQDLSAGLADLRQLLAATGIKSEAEQLIEANFASALEKLTHLGAAAQPLRDFATLVMNRKQ